MLYDATRGRNLDIAKHILIAENPIWTHSLVVLFKKTPLTDREINQGIDFIEQANLKITYAPQHEDESRSDILQFLKSSDREQFIQSYPGDIRPETDDKPFYFRASKWTALLGNYAGGKGNLLIILGVAIAFAFSFIIVPLVISSREAIRNNGLYLWFFTFIGMGYIFLEMVLLVKFVLFLGHPIRSLTITLFSLLFFSSIGSYFSRLIMSKNLVKGVRALIQRQLMLPFIGISILSIIYGMFLPETFSMWMGLNLYSRIIISVLLIAPLGIMMGMPLPIGMTLLDFKENKLVLWAWGLNGVASVIGSILCIVIAHLMGYKVTFFLSAVCYLAAILCLMRLRYRYQKCEI
jgi:hypothetical protein